MSLTYTHQDQRFLRQMGGINFIGSREFLPDGFTGASAGASISQGFMETTSSIKRCYVYSLGQILSLKLWTNPHPLTSSSPSLSLAGASSCSASPLKRLMSSPFLDWLSVFIPVDLCGAQSICVPPVSPPDSRIVGHYGWKSFIF